MGKRKYGEAHVRIYSHELRTAAWQTMTPEAKALLVEMRSLFNGKGNRIFLSVREMCRRLGVGQWKAEKARDELLERGWIRVIEQGSFSRKTKHATVYALENEPLEDRDGAVPPKSYMTWSQKNTVRVTSTDGKGDQYRGPPESTGKGRHGTSDQYRQPDF